MSYRIGPAPGEWSRQEHRSPILGCPPERCQVRERAQYGMFCVSWCDTLEGCSNDSRLKPARLPSQPVGRRPDSVTEPSELSTSWLAFSRP